MFQKTQKLIASSLFLEPLRRQQLLGNLEFCSKNDLHELYKAFSGAQSALGLMLAKSLANDPHGHNLQDFKNFQKNIVKNLSQKSAQSDAAHAENLL